MKIWVFHIFTRGRGKFSPLAAGQGKFSPQDGANFHPIRDLRLFATFVGFVYGVLEGITFGLCISSSVDLRRPGRSLLGEHEGSKPPFCAHCGRLLYCPVQVLLPAERYGGLVIGT